MTQGESVLPTACTALSAAGIYEKALCGDTWAELFRHATDSGYAYVELSVDSSPRKLSRLEWTRDERADVRQQARAANSRIGTIVLSAHRDFPWGSADPEIRRRADALALDAVALAHDLGANCVQLAGYFSFGGPRAQNARDHFVEGVSRLAPFAIDAGVTLAIENVDGNDVLSAADGLALIEDIAQEDVKLYVDVGNYAGNELSVVDELDEALPEAYAVQFKDARSRVFRRVPFGEGDVPWEAVFQTLTEAKFTGPVSVEMWNDGGEIEMAEHALTWLRASAHRASNGQRH